MSDKTWKATERAIARKLGGERVSKTHLGDRSPDVVTAWLAVEVKHRRELPVWLKAAMSQAARNAGEGQLPVVVLHESGQRHDGDLVVLRLGDFQDWFGGLDEPSDAAADADEVIIATLVDDGGTGSEAGGKPPDHLSRPV